jgi:hypothetical protein
MSNYYILDSDADPNVIGVRDGGSQAEIHRGGFSDKKLYDRTIAFLGSYDSWIRLRKEPDFNIELQCVRLKKSAKITDFMRYGPVLLNCPFIVSENVKKIFSKFNIGKYNIYNVNVYTKDDSFIKYNLFFCMSLDFNVINFEKSVLYTGLSFNKNNILKIRSLSQYEDFVANTNEIFRFSKYVLNDNFDRTLDLFVLGSRIFVSEKLCREIINNGLTGIILSPAFGENLHWPIVELDNLKINGKQ